MSEAFIEMTKMAIKRESLNKEILMPDTIGGAGGSIQLHQRDALKKDPSVEQKMCSC